MNAEQYLKDLLQTLAYEGMNEDEAREIAPQFLVDYQEMDWDTAEDMVGAMLAKEWDEMLADAEEARQDATETAREIMAMMESCR